MEAETVTSRVRASGPPGSGRETEMQVVSQSGADLLAASLVGSGATTMFGVPGDTGVAFYDALYRNNAVRHILARDERHAALMADCYARVTGRVGVLEVSSGGGCTYAVGGLGESFAASVPLLVIASDIQKGSRGTGALTEINQQQLFSAVTKWQRLIESPDDIPVAVDAALTEATSGRPAPVVLIIPEDVLDDKRPSELSHAAFGPNSVLVPRVRPVADRGAIETAAEVLSTASRPAVVSGSGVHWSQAWGELDDLIEYAGLPACTTIHGKGTVSDRSPWYLGTVGGNGASARANEYLRSADVVLFVGTRANATDTDGFACPPRSTTRVIHIDIERSRAGRNYPGSIPLVGDAAATLKALRAVISVSSRTRNHALLEWMARSTPPLRKKSDEDAVVEALAAADVVSVLDEVFEGRPHRVVADPGTPTPYVASMWRTPVAGRTVIVPRGHGPMGYAIPAAIGAAVAHPDETVLALVADGSFAMSCGELETAHRLALPIVFVQFTNNSLGWIKMLQHLFTGRRYFGVDPGPTDAVMVARACGVESVRASSLAELRMHVNSAIGDRRPVYVDVPVKHMIDDVPPVSSWQAALNGDTSRPSY